MKAKSFLPSLILASLALPASAATVTIDVDVNLFDNGTSNKSSSDGSLNQTARSTAGVAYQITGVDLTTIGGTASETIDFTINFAATAGGNPATINYRGWNEVGVNGNTDVGESISVSLGSISSSYGTASFVGFSNALYGALQSGESADTIHDGGTISTNGPATNVGFPASSSFTIAPTSGTMNLAGYDLGISVVPEPTSAALLGLASCSLLLRRRRGH